MCIILLLMENNGLVPAHGARSVGSLEKFASPKIANSARPFLVQSTELQAELKQSPPTPTHRLHPCNEIASGLGNKLLGHFSWYLAEEMRSPREKEAWSSFHPGSRVLSSLV